MAVAGYKIAIIGSFPGKTCDVVIASRGAFEGVIVIIYACWPGKSCEVVYGILGVSRELMVWNFRTYIIVT